MDDLKWERAAGVGGILFVVLVMAAAFLPGTPPMTSDSPREIAKWFADNDDSIRQAMFLSILASIPIVWWGAAVYRMLERSTGNARLGVMAAVGIAVAAAASSISAVVYGAIAIVGVDGAGGVNGTRFFYILATNLNAVVLVGMAILLGSVSAGVLRTTMMPKAIGWFGALIALLSVVGTGMAASTREAFSTLAFVSFLAFALWVLIVSVLMLRGPQTAAAEPDAT